MLTNDDAITVISQPIILNITERHSNKNGCKMPATWYTSIEYTDPNLVKQVFIRGHGEPQLMQPERWASSGVAVVRVARWRASEVWCAVVAAHGKARLAAVGCW